MTNEFYEPPELLAPGIKARSADINQINQRLTGAFDRLPPELAMKGGFVNFASNQGTVNDVYLVTLASKITAYVDGLEVKLRPLRDNTGACTINVNGIGNIPIKRTDGSNPQAADIQANATIYLSYSAALNAFVLPPVVNSQLASASAAAAIAVAARDEAAAWATSLAIVSGGLYGARKYANDAAAAAAAAAGWATSLASVDGTYFGARKYAIDAAAAAAMAQDWATKMNGVVSGGLYSAQYWAGQAQTYANQTAAAQVQADWAQTSTASKAFIWNKPDIAAMIAASTPDKLAGIYVSGGTEKPSYFGSGKLRLQMLQGEGANIPYGSPVWNDVLWMSSYTGGDVKGSNALVMGKSADFLGFSRQDYDSGAWGPMRTVWHSGNMPVAVSAIGSTLVQRTASGYIDGNYIAMSDEGTNGTAGTVTGIITKRGDAYYRTTNAASVKTFLAINGYDVTTNWMDRSVDVGIAKELRWDKYGNGHVIIDASNRPAENGANINNKNAQVPWAPNYPVLMGWNGTQTHGVRVDSARLADTADRANVIKTLGTYVWNASTAPGSIADGIQNSFVSAAEGYPNYGGVIRFKPYLGGGGGAMEFYTPYSPGNGGIAPMIRLGNYESGAWNQWATLLTSLNWNDYAPSKGGGGAYGSWGISISGQASYLQNFNVGGRSSVDVNSLTVSGTYGFEATPPNAPYAYGAMLVAANSDTGLQVAGGYNSDGLFFRGWSGYGSTFTAWRSVVHSGNIAAQSVSYASSAGTANSATTAGTATAATEATEATNARFLRHGGTADGQLMSFSWLGQEGSPPWLWGGSNGVQMYVYQPSNLSVSYAAGAGKLAGYDPTFGPNANSIPIRDANGWIASGRTSGVGFASSLTDNFTWLGQTVHHYGMTLVTYSGATYNCISGYAGTKFFTNGAERVEITNGGQLNCWGAIYASGDVTASSDERLKTNWRPVADDFVARWAGVESGIFDRVDMDLTQAGLSAQSVQAILPEAVIEGEKYLSLNYGGAAAVATVELAKKVVAQDQEIAELRKLVAALTARFETMEK